MIIGATGMLGHKLYQRLSDNFEVSATLRGEYSDVSRFGIFDESKLIGGVDVLKPETVESAIDKFRPEVVINAVGVIKQLPTVGDAVKTIEINSVFPHRLAEFGAKFGFRLITVGTDCVFDGKKGMYKESDLPNAYDLYGKSKHLGEVDAPNCLTIRSSIIGRELDSTHSLVEWFLSNRGGSVKGFTKAIYSGFPTVVFADIIKSLILEHKELTGLYQISSEAIDKFHLLRLIGEAYNVNIEITPSDDLIIDRSLNSSIFREMTGFVPLSWQEMVKQMADDITPYDQLRRSTL